MKKREQQMQQEFLQKNPDQLKAYIDAGSAVIDSVMETNKEERRQKIMVAKRAQKERDLGKRREIEEAKRQEEDRQNVLARIREA